MRNCLACGDPLHPTLGDAVHHPSCLMVEPVEDESNSFSEILRARLIEIIMWHASRSPRAEQANIGPSEMGSPCDRQLAYRLSGLEPINTRQDPWPAVVGTTIHRWLQEAVNEWVVKGMGDDFITETELDLDGLITGHCDLYDVETQTVIDWKTVGPNALKAVEAGDVSPGYKIQTHIYGYLFARMGVPVKRVSLVFIPRASSLNRLRVWSALYDESVALTALNRVYLIAQLVLELDLLNRSNQWPFVPAVGGDHCAYCPMFEAHRMADADDKGCPGR